MDKGLSLEKVIEILDNTSDSRSRSAYDLAKDAVEGMPLDQYNHLYRHMRDLLDRAQDDLSQSFESHSQTAIYEAAFMFETPIGSVCCPPSSLEMRELSERVNRIQSIIRIIEHSEKERKREVLNLDKAKQYHEQYPDYE